MTVRTHKSLLVSVLLAVAAAWTGLFIQAERLVTQLNSYAAEGWAVDAPVYYPALYHVLIVPLAISVIFAKRFHVALVFVTIYLGLQLVGIYLAFQTCFLGEDICPQLPLLTRLNNMDWFPLSITVAVPVVFIWILCLAINKRARRIS